MLTDTHCHLDFDAFESDREVVLQQCRNEAIIRLLNPGIDIESSHKAISLSDTFPEVFAAVGVHPNDATSWNNNTKQSLCDFCKHPKVIAIGEIGLDYYQDRTPKEVQLEVFQEQLELAAELGLPVIIHCREAQADLFSILSIWHEKLLVSQSPLAKTAGVLHSFTGSAQDAQAGLRMNFLFGVNGVISFNKAENLRQTLKTIPLTHIILETDAPFLTPHPHRGERNQPAYIVFIAQKLAALHGLSLEAVAKQTTKNAESLFHWGEQRIA